MLLVLFGVGYVVNVADVVEVVVEDVVGADVVDAVVDVGSAYAVDVVWLLIRLVCPTRYS